MLLLSACSKSEKTELIEASIGFPLPAKYSGHGSRMGAFTFISVPVYHPELSAQMQQVNLFTDSESGVVAGYRGDRPMDSEVSCRSAAKEIDAILSAHYPDKFSGGDPRYRYQSRDAKIVSGVRCAKSGALYTLTLEVTDPLLEAQLMGRSRNEH